MKKLLPLFILSLIVVASCKRTKVVTCDTGAFSFVGIGFSDSDFNGATITQYEAGSSFSKVVQSGTITYYVWTHGIATLDSGNVMPGSVAAAHTPNNVSNTYDYIISIPVMGISDTISNVTFRGPAQETVSYDWPYDDKDMGCSNPVVSYTYNGQVITSASGPSPWNNLSRKIMPLAFYSMNNKPLQA